MWAVLGFMLEISRVRETVAEPILGQIRLQWWREALEEIYTDKPLRRHEGVQALAEAIRNYRLPQAPFEALLDARALDIEPEPPATLAELERYLHATAGLTFIVGLEMSKDVRKETLTLARHAALAYGLVGILRAVPYHARHGKVWLPQDLLAAEGISSAEILENSKPLALQKGMEALLGEAKRHLLEAREGANELGATSKRAFLPLAIAGYYTTQMERRGLQGFIEGQKSDGMVPFWLWWKAMRGTY